MNQEQYFNALAPFLDKNGNIKPQLDGDDSGNGLSYNNIDVMLRDLNGFSQGEEIHLINECMPTPGLLYRTPQNTYGQESWDDYLRVASTCITLSNTEVPRQIIAYALKHFFFMTNVAGSGWKSFLLRFPLMWLCMFAAAFPIIKWLFYVPLFTYCLFCTPNINDSSGSQLQMTYQYIFKKLYNINFVFNYWLSKFNQQGSDITEIFQTYYDSHHAFTLVVRANQINLTK